MAPLPRDELPPMDHVRMILHEFTKYTFFKRTAPTNPVVLPPLAPPNPPFDIFQIPAHPVCLRDLDFKNSSGQGIPPRPEQLKALLGLLTAGTIRAFRNG